MYVFAARVSASFTADAWEGFSRCVKDTVRSDRICSLGAC